MKTTLLLIFSGLAFTVQAQQRSVIKSRLLDSASADPIQQATVSILKSADSSFLTYTLSDKKGEFEIKNLSAGNYLLAVSASGYSNAVSFFTLFPNNETTLPSVISIGRDYKNLSEAIVRSESPVTIKGDSISFKLNFFKAPPGASLEDALKKIPGIQVGKDGTVKAMGETVQKIYVDGKEFFGNDPLAATKNLTADMIDQVQVFDDMSEQARFTKIDDGNRYKAMNIRLKKETNKGDFGKINAGQGTGNRYEYGGSWNHFNGSRKISLIGGASNTNKTAYSAGLNNSTTQFSSSNTNSNSISKSGGATGINANAFAGFNYNDQWSREVDFRSSYLYSSNNNRQEFDRFTNYAYPGDSSAEMNKNNLLFSKSFVHRFNPRIEYSIDSFHTVLFTANFSIQDGATNEKDSLFGLSWGKHPYLSLLGSSTKNEIKNNLVYSGELLYRLRFRLPGRTFTFGWKNGFATGDGTDNLYSAISNYNADRDLIQFINPDQHSNRHSVSRYNGFSASFTNPAGRNKLVEINYAFNSSHNEAYKKTFDYNLASGMYDKANLYQTNNFNNFSQSGRAGLNYRAMYRRFSYQLGSSIQFTNNSIRNLQPQAGKDSLTRQRSTNFFPSMSFNYTINRNTNFRLGYRGRTSMPSVAQLQDVTDLSFPLFIRTGNPQLRQEFSSMVNLNFNHYNPRSSLFMNAALTMVSTSNKIVNSIDSGGQAIMIIRPVNLGGFSSSSGNLSMGLPIKSLKGANIIYNLSTFFSKDPALVFNNKYYTRLFVVDQSLGVNYISEKTSIGLNAGMVFNQAAYEIQRSVNNSFKFTWSADFRYQFKNDFFLVTDLENYNHSGRTHGFNPGILLWNMALAKKLLKNRCGEIKFTAYDIFKQDKGISRFSGENFIEDTRYKLTPGFFLISFAYTFKTQLRKDSAEPKQEMLYFK